MSKLSDIRLAEWLEQVAGGLDSGMNPSNAVSLARVLPHNASSQIQASLDQGNSWVEALAESSLELSDAELAILEASAMAGRLPIAMRRLAVSRRETFKVKRQVRLSLAYPLFLIHFAALVFSISYLVNGDMASFLVSVSMVVIPVWLVLVFFFVLAKVWPEGCKAIARRMPVVGSYFRCRDTAILCEVLAGCFSAGMNVREAWAVAVLATGSPVFDKLGIAVEEEIEQGKKASGGIDAFSKDLPNGFLQLYRNGEETGELDRNLEAAAERYRTDANNKLVLASVVYPKVILLIVFGYIAYKIINFVADYYQQLLDITATLF